MLLMAILKGSALATGAILKPSEGLCILDKEDRDADNEVSSNFAPHR